MPKKKLKTRTKVRPKAKPAKAKPAKAKPAKAKRSSKARPKPRKPATTSAMFGTAPRADASITPFFSTRRTHFEPRVAGLRGIGLALEERFALAGLAMAGFAFAGLALGRTFVRVFSFFLGIAS